MVNNEIIVIAPKRGGPKLTESGSDLKGPIYEK